MKKFCGKLHFKWLAKNDDNSRKKLNEKGAPVLDKNGKEQDEIIPLEELSEDNWNKYPGTTTWGIGWVPLGGYCAISGMVDETTSVKDLQKEPQPWEFRSKSTLQRLLIMVGGVLMNFVLAFFLYSVIVFKWGDNYIPIDRTPLYFGEVAHNAGFQDGDILLSADGKHLTRYDELDLFCIIKSEEVTVLRSGQEQTLRLPEDFKLKILSSKMPFADFRQSAVDSVIAGSFAEQSGLQSGDRIIAINEDNSSSFSAFSALLSKAANSEVALTVLRGDEKINLTTKVDGDGKIGFYPLIPEVRTSDTYNIVTAIPAGFKVCFRKLAFYVLQLRLVFTKEGMQNIGGFGAIGNMFPPQWSWPDFWNMTALLSIILGVMNLLPVPALDGGHVLFILYEIITRRKPSDKFLEKAQYIGMILLIALMLYANGNDILRLFN
jgi:regulator of sigma E protease